MIVLQLHSLECPPLLLPSPHLAHNPRSNTAPVLIMARAQQLNFGQIACRRWCTSRSTPPQARRSSAEGETRFPPPNAVISWTRFPPSRLPAGAVHNASQTWSKIFPPNSRGRSCCGRDVCVTSRISPGFPIFYAQIVTIPWILQVGEGAYLEGVVRRRGDTAGWLAKTPSHHYDPRFFKGSLAFASFSGERAPQFCGKPESGSAASRAREKRGRDRGGGGGRDFKGLIKAECEGGGEAIFSVIEVCR